MIQMAITVTLPGVLAKLADGNTRLKGEGATVAEVVSDLAKRFPALEPRLRDAEGNLYEFVAIYLNDEDIRLSGGFDATVAQGDELTVVPAVAGG
jgi:molybdopterin synthase sulfur carrier subunit